MSFPSRLATIHLMALLLSAAAAAPAQEWILQGQGDSFVIGLNAFNRQVIEALEKQPTRRVLVLPLTDMRGRVSRASHFITEQLITAIAATGSFHIVDPAALADLARLSGLNPLELCRSTVYQGVASQYANTSIVVGTLTDLGTRVAVMARVIRGESGQLAGGAQVYLRAEEEIGALLASDRAAQKATRDKPEEEAPRQGDAKTADEHRAEQEPGEQAEKPSEQEQPGTEELTDAERESREGTTPPADADLDSMSENSLYDKGRDFCDAGDFPKSIVYFRKLLERFPDSPLADNAAYWIGECHYARKEFEEALAGFRKVLDNYPYGNKVPAAMLKIGYTLEQLDRLDEAIEILDQLLQRFGESQETDLARRKLQILRAARQP